MNEHHEHRGDVQSHVHASNIVKRHHKMNINEHTEHFWGEEKIHQDIVSNLSDFIQHTCDISNNNDIVMVKNVH